MYQHGISIQQKRLMDLFRDMVNIYSPSGKEEDLTTFLWEYIASKGLAIKKQPVDESRCNLLISSGRATPDTLFLGHIDTIAAPDIENFEYNERGGVCFGLGSADMKGGCAALIEAFLTAAMGNFLPDNVMLALVVGEEENGDGTSVLLDEYSFKRALVAEPTDLTPCLDHYGYIEMNLRTFGERRHAALSDHQFNAIRAMLRFLLNLEEYVESSKPHAALNIRDLHSSESGFAVPDSCAVSIDFHIPPDYSTRSYMDSLLPFIESRMNQSDASRHELEFPTLSNGFRVGEDESLSVQLKDIYNGSGLKWNPGAFKSHSDANLLFECDCKPIILGPGQLAKAHTIDESVTAAQVIDAAEIFTRLLFHQSSS
ncbi:M20/M25/M40 family metallo-hydrolase [Chitinispirillales bacterium ANBcel5]|uniref:M20 family metallopeptidase n=1 Tax=Cellulosispirillum alkaliphilum TaxID=3039283 RepID=UPI002A587C4A|nr:M20/M25/M40 family metallo-hydrolase [Chitinispirillales bacterium ANBcel5]